MKQVICRACGAPKDWHSNKGLKCPRLNGFHPTKVFDVFYRPAPPPGWTSREAHPAGTAVFLKFPHTASETFFTIPLTTLMESENPSRLVGELTRKHLASLERQKQLEAFSKFLSSPANL